MGAWGIGNLENDGAQDALANMCDALFGEIIKLLQQPSVHQYDDDPISDLFVKIEAVFALKERNMISVSPSVEDLEPLLETFLRNWIEYSGPQPEREAVIVETFLKLRAVVDDSANEGFSHRFSLISEKMGKNPAFDERRDELSEDENGAEHGDESRVTLADLMGDDAPNQVSNKAQHHKSDRAGGSEA